MSSEDFLSELETLFMALADKTRLRLLNLMREDEICVCFFTEVLGESQPKISRHLAYLRNAGLVSARRDGKWMHYRIEEPENIFAAQIFRETLDALANQDDMRQDHDNLINACCSFDVPTTIVRAPKSDTLLQTNMSVQTMDERASNADLETYLL
jgi:ArsR family transcriptional regulator